MYFAERFIQGSRNHFKIEIPTLIDDMIEKIDFIYICKIESVS